MTRTEEKEKPAALFPSYARGASAGRDNTLAGKVHDMCHETFCGEAVAFSPQSDSLHRRGAC